MYPVQTSKLTNVSYQCLIFAIVLFLFHYSVFHTVSLLRNLFYFITRLHHQFTIIIIDLISQFHVHLYYWVNELADL